MSSVYSINKCVNRPIEFKGLRGQWIAWMAAGLVGLLVDFAILYICRLPLWILLPLIFGGGSLLILILYRLNKRYGEYGLMKLFARRNQPEFICFRSRKIFTTLNQNPSKSHGNH